MKNDLLNLLRTWESEGIPPRWTLISSLRSLKERREEEGATLIERPYLILTATLDDGWGVGLETIHAACEALGIKYVFLGLMVPPELIIQKCAEIQPDMVGLTILHEPSLELLKELDQALPKALPLLVGGLKIEGGEFSARLRPVRNVLDFVKIFLKPREY